MESAAEPSYNKIDLYETLSTVPYILRYQSVLHY
jgi:hypothetical protein